MGQHESEPYVGDLPVKLQQNVYAERSRHPLEANVFAKALVTPCRVRTSHNGNSRKFIQCLSNCMVAPTTAVALSLPRDT